MPSILSWSSTGQAPAAADARPPWRTAMTAGTWAEVGANVLNDIDPANDETINPDYPDAAPWHGTTGFRSVSDTWTSFAWEEANWRLHSVCNGGHGDYGGNEHLRLDLGGDLTWEMLRAPTGAIGNTGTLDDGLASEGDAATGVYFDGVPRAVHTYNYELFVPGLGVVLVRMPAPYRSVGTTDKAFLCDPDTGDTSLLLDYSSASAGGGLSGGAAYDSSRNCIWFYGTGAGKLCKLDIDGATVTKHGALDNHHGAYVRFVYIPEADILVAISSSTTGYVDVSTKFSMWDLTTFTQTVCSYTGSLSAGLTLSGQAGMVWDGSKLLLWDNTANTTEISTLTPDADFSADGWTAGTLTVDGANAVTPTTHNSNGTFGKFFYSPSLGGCGLVNDVTEKLYFFATE